METIVIRLRFTVQSRLAVVDNDFQQDPTRERDASMSAHCQVTGRTPGFGNTVSHSHRRSRRRWNPNIQRKTYYVPSESRRITLTVSAKGIKVIDRDGIDAVVARLRRKKVKI
jgi:large subunit ribosomal protein L28